MQSFPGKLVGLELLYLNGQWSTAEASPRRGALSRRRGSVSVERSGKINTQDGIVKHVEGVWKLSLSAEHFQSWSSSCKSLPPLPFCAPPPPGLHTHTHTHTALSLGLRHWASNPLLTPTSGFLPWFFLSHLVGTQPCSLSPALLSQKQAFILLNIFYALYC